MLEYDDERSGGFEPLKVIPNDKMAILGLVTTKTSRRETVKSLQNRVLEASQYFPLENLGISPQCGFATSVIGNAITPADQDYKLKLVVDAAREIWG